MTTTAATTTNTPWVSTAWAPAPPSILPANIMDVIIRRDGLNAMTLHFEKGEIIGETARSSPTDRKEDRLHRHTGSPTWRSSPTIDIPGGVLSWTSCKRQAVVNAGITFRFTQPGRAAGFDDDDFRL